MTLNDMAAVAAVGGKWTFEVDRIAGRKTPEVRAIHRLGYGVGGPPVVTPLDDGQTAPVHGDRRPHLDVAEHSRRRNRPRAPSPTGATERMVPTSSTKPVNIDPGFFLLMG